MVGCDRLLAEPCVWVDNIRYELRPTDPQARQIIHSCLIKHERTHKWEYIADQSKENKSFFCFPNEYLTKPVVHGAPPLQYLSEENAYSSEVVCLQTVINNCKTKDCYDEVKKYKDAMDESAKIMHEKYCESNGVTCD